MSARSFVVIGGGPAGLSAAFELARHGLNPLVLEQRSAPGGIARTESYKGYRFDMGGHRFFTKSAEVQEFWEDVLGDDFLLRPRRSRIYYRNRFFHYPLKPFDALIGLGPVEGLRIVSSYLRWQLRPYRQEETFEQWVTNRFGRRLYQTFFKTYTEKVWGIPCSELKAEWAAQRIKDLSLRAVLLSLVRRSRQTIKTLIEEFHYPRLGPGMMWEAVCRRVSALGGEVRFQAEVVRIRRRGNVITHVELARDGGIEMVSGTDFISSMPVTDLIKRLDPPPPASVLRAAKQLRYRDFLTVALIVDQPHLFSDNWIYVHAPEVRVARIQNFKNWSPDMVPDPGKTSLGLEYFCNEGDELWTAPDEELVELARRELSRIGLARYEDVSDGCVFRVPKSYPVYDADYRVHLAAVRSYVDGLDNCRTVGRNGLHRYNNQDHSMLTGIYAVRNMLHGEANDLWAVNADAEYHEQRPGWGPADEPVRSAALVRRALAMLLARIDPVALGAALGSVCGLGLCLLTLVLVVKGGSVVGPNLSLLAQFLPGYRVTPAGSLAGLAYGASAGFATGWLFATLRNATIYAYVGALRHRVARAYLSRVLDDV